MRFFGLVLLSMFLFNGIAFAEDGGVIIDATASVEVLDPSLPATVPADGAEAFDAAKGLVENVKAKEWFAFSAGIIWLIMFLLKVGRKSVGFMKKMPKRVLWIVVPILSIVAMVLAKLQGDLSWGAAVGVLFSGPSAAFFNDFVKRGVLGKEPSSGVN